MKRTWSRLFVATAAIAALAGGCARADTGANPAPAPPTPAPSSAPSGAGPSHTPATQQPSTPVPSRSTPGGGIHRTQSAWTSGSTIVVHDVAVPPVPVLVGVRSAAHPQEGYDRIVFDIRGALPGYSVRYVSQVRADPSDRPVAVPGRRLLLVVFTPAQAHHNSGNATVSGIHSLNLSMMRGYAVTGDFEGYVSIAIGLDDVVGYRVGELPGRIYLDVAA